MIEINRNDFEAALPVGISSHDELFGMIRPAAELSLETAIVTILGDAGVAMIEAASETDSIVRHFKRVVYIDAFLQVFRQLDLTLTPSGFGVVSNDNTSPASQARVDALHKSLLDEFGRAHGSLLHYLRSEEWGSQEIARLLIPYPYTWWDMSLQSGFAHPTQEQWKAVSDVAAGVDKKVRLMISDEQMDSLTDIYRRSAYDKSAGSLLAEFFWQFRALVDAIRACDHRRGKALARNIMQIAESDSETFALYFASENYTANHYENFQNTKESTGYLFNG